MAEFKFAKEFAAFSHEIRRHRRFVRSQEAEDFLHAVAMTCKSRYRLLKEGMPLWRAQLGNDWRENSDSSPFQVAVPFEMSRMKPKPHSALEGRANPKGIPCLYVATTKHAAMSEVRPWIGALVSVAQFSAVRPLSIVDCSVLHDQHLNLLLDWKPNQAATPERIQDFVWAAIDAAFAEPVSRVDDVAEYAATQILAELFKSEGYDGVAYKSAFGEDAYNVALFDLDSAKQLDCALYEVTGTAFEFEESGNPYYVTEKPE